ncbi:hypothetical protein UlMin_028073 [Ulmus minor]
MERMCQQFSGRNFNEIGEGSGVQMGGRFSKGGTSSTNFLPRILKLDFPWYDGQDDPVTWMSRVEKYFFYHLYFEGNAQMWFQTLEHEILYVTWKDFRNGFFSHFGQNQFEDPFSKLIKLWQTSSVINYQSRFEKALTKVGSLSKTRKFSCFITCLKDSI